VPTPKKAAAKKTAAKKTTPRDLTKAEAFYVESHFGQKPPKVIAADIDAPVESVEAYIEQLREAGFEPAKQKTPVQKAGFSVKDGTVSMTRQASEIGDETRGVTADGAVKRGKNDAFLKRRVDGIHVINPNLPTY